MNLFDAWNLRLLTEYFPERSAGEEVFLDTSCDKLDELGPDLGGDVGFLAAVKEGPSWSMPDAFVGRVKLLLEQRTTRARRPPAYIDPGKVDPTYQPTDTTRSAPTYLPYVAAMARAASKAEDDGYYAQLRRDLQLPDSWNANQMATIAHIWNDLEAWTAATNGHFGRFNRRIVGNYRLIGLPKSQIVIAARDLPILERIFQQRQLAPSLPPSTAQLDALIGSIPNYDNGDLRLSSALRAAAGNKEYRELLRVRLEAIAEEWDGSTDDAIDQASADRGQVVIGSLGLLLSEGNELPWRARINIAKGLVEGERLALCSDHLRLELFPKSGNGMVSEPAPATREILSGDRQFRLSEGEASRTKDRGRVQFRNRLISVLVGETSETGIGELVEGALPAAGGAYLLVAPEGRNGLEEYLRREQPVHQHVSGDGLPDGWQLVYLEPQVLSTGQRTLPDGNDSHPVPRSIRFEGGVSVRRSGMRAYLPYDLPTIVLDAPPGTALSCDAFELEEVGDVSSSKPSAEGLSIGVGLRRFRLPTAAESGGVAHLSAKLNDRVVGQAKIRVRPTDAAVAAAQGNFSLDASGRPQAGKHGLLGGLRDTCPEVLGSTFELPTEILGERVEEGYRFDSLGACFLDALAQAGAMSYGRARDLILRMGANRARHVRPSEVLKGLWARGHIEVARSGRGHFERIYSVPPAAYVLPITAMGARILGILGTPTLRQLAGLAAERVGWTPLIGGRHSVFPALRLRSAWEDDQIRPLLAKSEFDLLPFQGQAIAKWSASSEQILQDLASTTYESLGGGDNNLTKLNVESGWFNAANRMQRPGEGNEPSLQLYRMLDRDTGAHRLHVAAMPQGYSFVSDGRWGRWLALQALCTFLAERLPAQFGDLSRWPLPYDERLGELWLPECLRLPTVLERAAVLCSGDAPDSYELVGEETHDGVILMLASTGTPIRSVSNVYARMSNGPWLRYRWIPRSVVNALFH